MITVEAYEFKDLSPEVQEKVRDRITNELVEIQLGLLWNDVAAGNTTEEEAWEVIGCSKSYGESTPWFTPACYYENNQEFVDEEVDRYLNRWLFNEFGEWFANKEEVTSVNDKNKTE